MSSIDEVRQVVADALGIAPERLADDASMDSVEAWDSLQHLGVITAIEAAFACRLSPAEIPELTSIDRIAARVEGER